MPGWMMVIYFHYRLFPSFIFLVFNQEYDRLFHGKKPVYDEEANKARREKHRADLQAQGWAFCDIWKSAFLV